MTPEEKNEIITQVTKHFDEQVAALRENSMKNAAINEKNSRHISNLNNQSDATARNVEKILHTLVGNELDATNGLVLKVKKHDDKIDALESKMILIENTHNNLSKAVWILVAAVVGILAKMIVG